MKNYIVIVLYILTFISISNAQEPLADTGKLHSVIVSLPEFYKEKGVIFDGTYKVGIDMKDIKSRYTPTVEDVTKAEALLINQYNKLQNTNVDTKQLFRCWVRQYVGLIDINGDKNIIIQLINNERPKKINRMLGKGWESDFIIMLSNEFYAVSNRFRVNINTGYLTAEL